MIERLGERPRMPDGTPAAYSPIVRAGGFVFLSGQLPFDPQRRIVPGGIAEHTSQCYDNVRHLLQAAGCDLCDVVRTVNYLANAADFPLFNASYLAIFADTLPVRSTVCVKLLVPAAALEVDVIAFKGA